MEFFMDPINDELKLFRGKKRYQQYQQYQESLDEKKPEPSGHMHGKKVQQISSKDSSLHKHIKPS
jgi:hypothetical protein